MANISTLGLSEESTKPGQGWHCSHFFYSFDRCQVADFADEFGEDAMEAARIEFVSCFEDADDLPARLQLGIVSGHKADFSLMMMDPDPIKIESVHQRLMSSAIGLALEPTYSYVSISEISEYVQSPEQYKERLVKSGEDANSSAVQTKIKAYEARLQTMNYQRLTPDFPEWPVSCFYPMNKWRIPDANWFTLPVSERNRLMGEHARSGIKFAGKVSQLITVGIGLDDWEWGVTLWATNPLHLKQIVYDMRFDRASAKYAEFGPFFTSYIATPQQVLDVCQVG